jgi:hypothetical protein
MCGALSDKGKGADLLALLIAAILGTRRLYFSLKFDTPNLEDQVPLLHPPGTW